MNTKIAQAGYRVLELLKKLSKGPMTPLEMLRCLEETTDNTYRKEVVHKYLSTLRLLNIDIIKSNNKYFLKKSFNTIDFDKRDLSLMLFIQKYASKINHEAFKSNIQESLQIIEKNFSQKTNEIIEAKKIKPYKPEKPVEITDENVKQFEKYCEEGLKINICYKKEKNSHEKVFKISPLKVIYKKCKAILIGYDSNDNDYKEFIIKNITFARQTPQVNIEGSSTAVLFKLKNRLARSYVLKKDEIILENGRDYIVVSNRSEDKELLLNRLLRYYDQCEVLYPRSFRSKMKEVIEEIQMLYE